MVVTNDNIYTSAIIYNRTLKICRGLFVVGSKKNCVSRFIF
jgi:hypothetical protein